VARVEKQTFVCTKNKEDTVPTPKEGVESKLGNWKHSDAMDKELDEKFTGCMKGEFTSVEREGRRM
jgi:phosphoenolpyruvate carboxykinase (GTP)